MKSRYDYIKASSVKDDDDYFPDPLTLNYAEGKLSKIPTAHVVTQADLDKFWKFIFNEYKRLDFDDVYLNINGIPYLGMLQPGSTLINPQKSDLTAFLTNRKESLELPD